MDIYSKLVLRKYNVTQVVNDILILTDHRPAVLVCYEVPDDFCHRHIVSRWINHKVIEQERVYEWAKDGSLYTPEVAPEYIIQPREAYRGHI